LDRMNASFSSLDSRLNLEFRFVILSRTNTFKS